MLRVEQISASTMSISNGISSVEIDRVELPELIQALQSAICDSTSSDLFGIANVPAVSTATGDLSGNFETWWRQYPRKVGKGAARKAYERVVKTGKAAPQELLAGLARYHPDPKFTKHPATWLNAECWLDEPEPQDWRRDPPSRADSAIEGIKNYLIRTGELS